MDYKVVVSALALNDLERIVRYISGANKGAAMRIGTRLIDRAQALAALPHRGMSVKSRPGVRRVIVAPYILFYRINEADRSVEVLRFWHGAREQRSLRI